ncbi:MAG: phosphoribosylformylglycinamidine synthase subunit PurL, partial [Pseudomonadota bacterium]
GEDQARYLLAIDPGHLSAVLAMAGEARVPAEAVGRTGGDVIALGREHLPLTRLAEAHANALPRLMGEL